MIDTDRVISRVRCSCTWHAVRMKTRFTLPVAIALAIATPALAHAEPLGGQRCDTPGAAQRANNGKFVCSPEGARSVWRRVDAPSTIPAIAEALRGYSTFSSLLKLSGLDVTLAQTGPYTVFAPRNAAFLALPKETLAALQRPDNLEALRRILRHHVVAGSLKARALRTRLYESLDGTMLSVVVANGVRVDGARVTVADVTATNGVLHGLGKVLIPSGVTIIP